MYWLVLISNLSRALQLNDPVVGYPAFCCCKISDLTTTFLCPDQGTFKLYGISSDCDIGAKMRSSFLFKFFAIRSLNLSLNSAPFVCEAVAMSFRCHPFRDTGRHCLFAEYYLCFCTVFLSTIHVILIC